jgi:transcription elongation factor Elf1
MKIIKQVSAQIDLPKKKTCYGCKSVLEYTRVDIKSDRDGNYIVCPVCGAFIALLS